MEILDNMKAAIQSGKEKAIIDSVMAMFGGQIRMIKPENTVSEFINMNAPALFMPDAEHKGEFTAMSELVAKLLVAEANDNPAYSYQKLREFTLAFQIWYTKTVLVNEAHQEIKGKEV